MAHKQQVRCKTSACFTTDFTSWGSDDFSSAAQTLPSPVTEPEEPQLWDKPVDSKEIMLAWEEGRSKRQLLKKMQEEMCTWNAARAKWTLVGQAPDPEYRKCHLNVACSSSCPSCSRQAPGGKARLGTVGRLGINTLGSKQHSCEHKHHFFHVRISVKPLSLKRPRWSTQFYGTQSCYRLSALPCLNTHT